MATVCIGLCWFLMLLTAISIVYGQVEAVDSFTMTIGNKHCECGCTNWESWDTQNMTITPHLKHLNVLFRQITPFVYYDKKNNKTTGLLVDLWNMVAEFNGWNYTAHTIQAPSNNIIEKFTNSPKLDVLLGDFTLTWKRINRYNVLFTTPFVSKGLLLMRKTPRTTNDGWWIVKSFTEWCWFVFFLFVALSAFVIWLCEHWENLSFFYVYKHFCCCKSVNDSMHKTYTKKSDKVCGNLTDNNEGTKKHVLTRNKSSRSVGDIEMFKTTFDNKSELLDGDTTYNQIQILPIDADNNNNENDCKHKKKPKFIPVMGNTLALFWFGGRFPHVRTAPAKFLISFLKLWVLVMSSFYMSNLTALRTAEITQPTKIQSTEDMWHARICAKANSFIEEFLYEELALPNVITCDKQPDCVEMLLNDDCDGFVASSHWTQYVSNLHCNLEVVGDLFRPEFASWILKRRSVYLSAINNALIKLKSEGVVDKLFNKYVDIPKRKQCDDNDAGGKFSGNENQVDVDELQIMWVCIATAWLCTLLMQCCRSRTQKESGQESLHTK